MNRYPTIMQLQENLTAPAFDQKDIFGRQINLNDYKDKRVFIGFFRHAGCPFCNLRVHALLKVHKQLKAQGLEMIFFFESKESVLLKSIFHKEISPIPLLSDPQKIWYSAYGLQPSGTKSAVSHLTSFVQTAFKARANGVPVHMMADGESISTMPAEFLLDRGLVIKKVHYAESLTDRLDMDMILNFGRAGTITA